MVLQQKAIATTSRKFVKSCLGAKNCGRKIGLHFIYPACAPDRASRISRPLDNRLQVRDLHDPQHIDLQLAAATAHKPDFFNSLVKSPN
ncbi:MAG: hypothetical protein ACJA1F_001496 [Paracoccaceae bacterium]